MSSVAPGGGWLTTTLSIGETRGIVGKPQPAPQRKNRDGTRRKRRPRKKGKRS